MSTLTLEHLTAPQREALGAAAAPGNDRRFAVFADRFKRAATVARLFDLAAEERVFRGFAALAADLDKIDDLDLEAAA